MPWIFGEVSEAAPSAGAIMKKKGSLEEFNNWLLNNLLVFLDVCCVILGGVVFKGCRPEEATADLIFN